VLGAHAKFPSGWPPAVRWFTDTWMRCGWVGVDLFFVLSGFLVSSLIFAEWRDTGRFAAGRFLVRRGFKIYPAYYTLWLLVFARELWVGHGFDVARLMNDFLFIQNYGPSEWPHTWSLAVEEHFYFGLALLCWLRARFHRGERNAFAPLVWIAVGIIVLCPLLRWYTAVTQPFLHEQNLFPTHLRIDSLMYGVVASWIWCFYRGRFADHVIHFRRFYLAGGCLLLGPTLFFYLDSYRWMYVWGFSIFAMGGLGLVLWALGNPLPSRAPVLRGLAWIGFYSYSIYLWHLPVARILAVVAGGRLPESVLPVCFLVASVVSGVLLGKLIDWPMLRLRDRWFPRSK
jgi:peptidoglycan/LPS O-acetylase OafA/YrhL